MAIDDLNIYTRLCEILIIYIWGYISIWVEMNRGEICGRYNRLLGERERESKRTKKEGYHKDIPLIGD